METVFLQFLKINKLRFTLGLLFLVAGTLEYIFSRSPGSAHFLDSFQAIVLSLHDRWDPFGALGPVAPDFFHPLAFALMCMALLPDTLEQRLGICLTWFGIDAGMELVQKYGSTLSDFLPLWAGKIPVIRNLPGYFIHGTFDNYDLLAIAAGSLAAFLVGHITRGGKTNEQTA